MVGLVRKVFLTFVLIFCGSTHSHVLALRQPNIVMILTDDQDGKGVVSNWPHYHFFKWLDYCGLLLSYYLFLYAYIGVMCIMVQHLVYVNNINLI